jgi:hypothetical protein
VHKADDDVGDLNAGVVDVILDADLVAGLVVVGAEQALEGVAENGVAQVANVGGLVGVDAGVLDQAKAGTANVGVAVGGDGAHGGGAVEADVEVAGAGDLDTGDAWDLIERGIQLGGEFDRDRTGGFAQALGEFKRDG